MSGWTPECDTTGSGWHIAGLATQDSIPRPRLARRLRPEAGSDYTRLPGRIARLALGLRLGAFLPDLRYSILSRWTRGIPGAPYGLSPYGLR